MTAWQRITLAISGLLLLTCSGEPESPEAESTQTAALTALTFQIGHVTSSGNSDRRTTYNYDAVGHEKEVQHAMDGAVYLFTHRYGYPKRALPPGATELGTVVLSSELPDGEVISYGYDSGGKRQTIRAGNDMIVAGTGRNAKNQLTSIRYGNGIETEYRRNDEGDLRLRQIVSTHRPAGGPPRIVQAYDYTFDEVGNTTEIRDYCRADNDECPCDPGAGACTPQQLSRAFEYDTMNRLTQARALAGTVPGFPRSYGYDAIDNLIVKDGELQTYGANAKPHALMSAGGVTHNYDRNGNLTSTSAGLTMKWTPQNMPALTTKNGQTVRKQFIGEAVWQKIEGGVTTLYLPAIRIENGAMRKYYGNFAERDPEAGGALRFYHGDHLSSSTLVTDMEARVVHRAAYLPFGEVDQTLNRSNSFVPTYRFNFKELEKATGLYDYAARMYNAATGRWLSADTSIKDGLNRYAYVRNNPLRYTDPTGHQSRSFWDEVLDGIANLAVSMLMSTGEAYLAVLELGFNGNISPSKDVVVGSVKGVMEIPGHLYAGFQGDGERLVYGIAGTASIAIPLGRLSFGVLRGRIVTQGRVVFLDDGSPTTRFKDPYHKLEMDYPSSCLICVGHGSPGEMGTKWGGPISGDGVGRLAKEINKRIDIDGIDRILLITCDGAKACGKMGSAAQRMANKTGKRVYGFEHPVRVTEGGFIDVLDGGEVRPARTSDYRVFDPQPKKK